MSRTVAFCVMIVAVASWLILTAAAPWVLSDENTFLKGFVNHEMLGFMGVLVTISLGSAANLHIELNKLEERAGEKIFVKTRTRIRHAASWLLVALVVSLGIVIVKPLAAVNGYSEAFINGLALLTILFSVLTMADITQTAFRLEPRV